MADLPTNPVADKINTVIAAGNSAGVTLVQSLLTADVPFLGWPIVRNVVSLVLGWLDSYLSKAEQTGVSFFVIDTQISSEEKALVAAVAQAEQAKDPAAIAAARKAYADANSALVRYDGDAPPH